MQVVCIENDTMYIKCETHKLAGSLCTGKIQKYQTCVKTSYVNFTVVGT